MSIEHIQEENQQGFSMIELLFVLALMGILTGMLTQSYQVYKAKAQHSSAVVLFNETRSSLEGGKIYSEEFVDGVMEVNANGPGAPGGDFGQILLQGLVVPDNHQVYVRHASDCDNALCVQDLISVRHCSTSQMATLSHFYGGSTIVNIKASATLPCG